MKDFFPERAVLVLKTLPGPESFEPVPIVVYPLQHFFEEGSGRWGNHGFRDGGCTWTNSTRNLQWVTEGGDFLYEPYALGTIPSSGSNEIDIDVTSIIAYRFENFHKTGKWEDPGMIIMRDYLIPSRCRFRLIHSFESTQKEKKIKFSDKVLSPELFIE